MKAATYARLSASRLGEDAPGLDRQRGDVERLVRERGWDLHDRHRFHDADTSAFREGVPRPGFDGLRAAVDAGEVGAVVVWKIDRAFRRLPEAVEFLKIVQDRGAVFVSQQEGIDTSTPWGPVLFSLFASIAQMESQTRRDRITAWHDQRAKDGKPAGGGTRPFGFDADGVAQRPHEVALIAEAARALLDSGTLSAVAAVWNRRGVLTPAGNPWSKSSVRRLMLSPRIAGLREHGEERYPAVWEPIISEDDHLRLRARWSSTREPSGRRYLLTGGVARCGVCGGKLIARPKADGRRCYVCANRGCGKIRVLAVPVEEFVASHVNTHREHRALGGDAEPVRNDIAAIRRQLAADEGSLEELARARFVTRSITEAEFRAARDELVHRIADAQEAVARAERPMHAETWEDLYGHWSPPWETPPGVDPDPDEFEAWRRWIVEFVESVTIRPAVKGRNFFDPSRIAITWRPSA